MTAFGIIASFLLSGFLRAIGVQYERKFYSRWICFAFADLLFGMGLISTVIVLLESSPIK